jgi:predicted CXXCH cytochrome family protein
MSTRRLSLALLVLTICMGACAGILGLKKKNASHPFEHRQHLVAGVACVRCHEGMLAAGDDAPLHLPTTESCTKCHEKPHDPRACADCHGSESTRVAAAGARLHLRFDHGKHLPSVKGQCVPCHSEAGARDPASLEPKMAQCFTCHQHADQFAVRDCDGCHRDLASEHTQPSSHVVHDTAFIREHGIRAASARDLCATCHAESQCASCHGVTTAALPWKLELDVGKFDRLHAAGFVARHPEEARGQPGLCTTCHAETFCLSCHESKKVSGTSGATSPHPPGWVRAKGGDHGHAARIDPASCASCHGGAGEQLCVGCHKVGGAGGNPHGPGFSSTRDKVKDLPCKLCHT